MKRPNSKRVCRFLEQVFGAGKQMGGVPSGCFKIRPIEIHLIYIRPIANRPYIENTDLRPKTIRPIRSFKRPNSKGRNFKRPKSSYGRKLIRPKIRPINRWCGRTFARTALAQVAAPLFQAYFLIKTIIALFESEKRYLYSLVLKGWNDIQLFKLFGLLSFDELLAFIS